MTALPISDAEAVQNVARYPSPDRAADDWPDPDPLPTVTPPPFPTDALGELRPYVEAVAAGFQVPADLPASLALAALAAGLARKAVVRLTPDHTEPLNQFFLCALPSANLKSPVLAEVTAPLWELQRDLLADAGPRLAALTSRRKSREQERDNLEKRAAQLTATAEDRDRDRRAAAALAHELATDPEPTSPTLLCKDVTPEALAQLLVENAGRLCCVSDEAEIFGPMLGRYARDGAASLDVYLNAHDGRTPVLVHRRTGDRRALTVERPALTLGLSVQPIVLHELANQPLTKGRGLLGRFLFTVPESRAGYRVAHPPCIPDALRHDWRALVRTCWALPLPEREHEVALSPEAERARLTFYDAVETELRPGGRFTGWEEWGGKLRGAVYRLAGVLHAARCVGELCEPWAVPIGGATMADAIRLGEHFTHHARLAFGMMQTDQADALAARLYPWILQRQSFTARECYRAHPGLEEDSNKLAEGPLAVLVEHGLIRLRPRAEGAKGRPSYRYDVNPKARAA
jgi:hypothetical protein